MEKYDVIVVGAGFGGPAAAKKCAEAGLRTLIVERGQRPGEKIVSGTYVPLFGAPDWIREGNPPLERAAYGWKYHFIKGGDIYLSIKVSFPFPISYGMYCRPMCTWLAEQAVKSGAELRTSTTAVDVIKEGDYIKGIVTDRGEELKSDILIDSEGLQNLLAIKAGIRKKYIPDAIELCLEYDFEMDSADVDRIFEDHIEFHFAMPEEKVIAPLGQGSVVYLFPYRNSIHTCIGQFLKHEGEVAQTSRLLETYYENYFQTRRWKEVIGPKAKLRAKMWDTCPLYVGLFPEMHSMPRCGNGILLIGDAAGFEDTSSGAGIANAWYSAEIAADVAIEALKAKDTSAAFLAKYDELWQAHPVLPRSISDRGRRNLLQAQKDEALMVKLGFEQWFNSVYDLIPMLNLMKPSEIEAMLPKV
jgi:electron transfer flavoprotein-quinone oxidoreductase